MKRVSLLGPVALLSVGLAQITSAQNSGAITGTVVDQKGGVIVGASVQGVDESKGIVMAEATTGTEGTFTLQPLQPGTYTVRVSAKGMKELEQKGIVLDSRQVLGLSQLMMRVGAASESVTVEATTPLVETATSDHAAVIDSRQVTEISMNGRDFQSLVRTLPGVVSNDSSDFRLAFNNTDSFHVDGLRGSDNNVFLDGAINTDVGANDGQYTQLSMDAVGEFKLQTSNFAAEYGRNPGVLLAINTKSGGKQFHGTVWEFNREDGFDANQFFNKVDPNGLHKSVPNANGKLRFNQFGVNLGGRCSFFSIMKARVPVGRMVARATTCLTPHGWEWGRPTGMPIFLRRSQGQTSPPLRQPVRIKTSIRARCLNPVRFSAMPASRLLAERRFPGTSSQARCSAPS